MSEDEKLQKKVEELYRCASALLKFMPLLVSFHSCYEKVVRERIIRNFIFRGATLLESILSLWRIRHYQDCSVLFRCILDRLFHLRDLATKEEFELFEKWSFVAMYEAQHRAVSDKQIRGKLSLKDFEYSPDQKLRYRTLKREKVCWRRPDAETVSKSMDMSFLYKFGYDYASMHVHPMDNDGQDSLCFFRGVEDYHKSMPIIILQNSVLSQLLLTQEGLNASSLRWRAIVYDFLNQCRLALGGDDFKYEMTLEKLVEAGPNFTWCEP